MDANFTTTVGLVLSAVAALSGVVAAIYAILGYFQSKPQLELRFFVTNARYDVNADDALRVYLKFEAYARNATFPIGSVQYIEAERRGWLSRLGSMDFTHFEDLLRTPFCRAHRSKPLRTDAPSAVRWGEHWTSDIQRDYDTRGVTPELAYVEVTSNGDTYRSPVVCLIEAWDTHGPE